MIARALTSFLLAVAVVGCDASGPEQDSVRFETEAPAYAPGATVGLRLTNTSDADHVGHNICFAFLNLERYDGRWVDAPSGVGPDDSEAACTAPLYGLAPGATAKGRAYLSAGLAPGTYRVKTRVEISDGDAAATDRTVVTNAFTVE